MSGLFSKPKVPEPEPPIAMPDQEDPASQRSRRRTAGTIRSGSGTAANRLAPVPGTIGREYSRSTLGAS